MTINSLGQKTYFNPMSWALEQGSKAVLAVNKALGGVSVSVALILGGAGLNYFSEPISGAVAEQIGSTQTAVDSTLDKVGNGMVAFGVGDIILSGAAKSYLGRKTA